MYYILFCYFGVCYETLFLAEFPWETNQSHRFCPFSPRKFLLIPPARDFWSYSNKIPVISNGTRKIVKITIKTENINKHSIQLNDRITGPVRKCWITLSTEMQNKKKPYD